MKSRMFRVQRFFETRRSCILMLLQHHGQRELGAVLWKKHYSECDDHAPVALGPLDFSKSSENNFVTDLTLEEDSGNLSKRFHDVSCSANMTYLGVS